MSDYSTDDKGNIATHPLTDWSIAHVAGAALLLTVRYVSTPDELERGDSKSLTLALTPQVALDLAEALRKHSGELLSGKLPPGTFVH